MFLVFLLTFLGTMGICALLAWVGCRRVLSHLEDNPDGCRAVMEHVVLPMLGRKKARKEVERKPDPKADVRKTKATLV